MNQFIIYLTAGTHIESAAKHSIGLSLVVIITSNVWALQLKVKGVQYSSSEKYLFEITNICVWLIHALHYYSIFPPPPCAFPCSELYLLAEAEAEGLEPSTAVPPHPGSGLSWCFHYSFWFSKHCISLTSSGIKLKSLMYELTPQVKLFFKSPPPKKFRSHIQDLGLRCLL